MKSRHRLLFRHQRKSINVLAADEAATAFSFVMEHEKLSYVETLRWLAAKYNIEVEETAVAPEVKLQLQTAESLYIINAFAQKFLCQKLYLTQLQEKILGCRI